MTENESFFVSDSLADRIDVDSLHGSSAGKGKDSTSGYTRWDTEAIFEFCDGGEKLVCELIGWEERSITVLVPASHVSRFYALGNAVGHSSRPSVLLFEQSLELLNCVAQKKDGQWQATVYFLGDI